MGEASDAATQPASLANNTPSRLERRAIRLALKDLRVGVDLGGMYVPRHFEGSPPRTRVVPHDFECGRAGRYVNNRRRVLGHSNGADVLNDVANMDAENRFNLFVNGFATFGYLWQVRFELSPQVHLGVAENLRRFHVASSTTQQQPLLPVATTQKSSERGRRLDLFGREDVHVRLKRVLLKIFGRANREGVAQGIFGANNARSGTLLTRDHPRRAQLLQRLTNRESADVERFSERGLARELAAECVVPFDDRVAKSFFNFGVSRNWNSSEPTWATRWHALIVAQFPRFMRVCLERAEPFSRIIEGSLVTAFVPALRASNSERFVGDDRNQD
jgi:hypothetical protein